MSENLTTEKSESSKLRQPHVLVVDDEPLICLGLYSALSEAGYLVEESYDGHQAFKPSVGDVWDLLITDYRLPSCNGFDVIRSLRKIHPRIPVVMISSYADSISPDLVKELGIACIIPKPFDLGRVVACADKLTRQASDCVQ
jgi:DNA-binding response OmpR family regulator